MKFHRIIEDRKNVNLHRYVKKKKKQEQSRTSEWGISEL